MQRLTISKQSTLALAIAQALCMTPASAATITVDSHLDDGVDCTLRDAFDSIKAGQQLANDCVASGAFGVDDTINFDSSLSTTNIALTQGDLYFGASSNLDLSIDGLGSDRLTISGNNNRIFYVRDSTLNLSDVTLSNGSSGADGGAIQARTSEININNCMITDNTAGALGGGIHATIDSVVNLSNTELINNTAREGAGLASRNSEIRLNNSNISGNQATEEGGGIALFSSNSTTLLNSTIANNSADKGAGIYGRSSIVSFVNTTVSGNTAVSNAGGIYLNSSSIELLNTTVVSNSSSVRSGLEFIGTTVTMRNSLISGNRSGVRTSASEVTIIGGNITATNNLFGDDFNSSSQAFLAFLPDASNIVSTRDGNRPSSLQALVGPLSNNRGLNTTHALKPNSLAINQADNSVCPVTDQRDESRSLNACDIGAVEYIQGNDAASIQVNSSTDDYANCTLREAIRTFNIGSDLNNGCSVSGSPGVYDVVNFAGALSGSTINLTQSNSPYLLNDGAYVVIDGPGKDQLEINGGGNSRILYVLRANASVRNVTLSGGNPSSAGGGAIRVRDGTLSVLNSNINANSATGGGGLATYQSQVRMYDTTILANTASGAGGGISSVESDVGIFNSTLSFNSANFGSGLGATNTNTVTLENVTISGNTAAQFASGIFFGAGTLSLRNATVANNSADTSSGGLYIQSSGSLHMFNSLFAGNRAPNNAEVRFNGAALSGSTNLFGDPENSSFQAFGTSNLLTLGSSILNTSDVGNPQVLGDIIGPLSFQTKTPVHPLRRRSIAVNRGMPNDCEPSDQRGQLRNDGLCDLGAFELDAVSDQATVVVDSVSDDRLGCTLREAVESFNSVLPLNNECLISGFKGSQDTIEFSPSINNGTITLSQPLQLSLTQPGIDLTIQGLGQSNLHINGGSNSGVFYVRDGNLQLNDLTISDASSSVNGGAVQAVYSTLSLNRVSLLSNTATLGGALSAFTSEVTVSASRFAGNTAQASGGALLSTQSDVQINGTNFYNNSAQERGGAIFVSSGNTTINNSTLSTNSTIIAGGAIASLANSSVSLNNTMVSRNQSRTGGGLSIVEGALSLRNSTLNNNTASANGGAIDITYLIEPMPIFNSTLSGNTALLNGGAIHTEYTASDIKNTTFFGNAGDSGGAIYNLDGTNTLNNTLFTANSASNGAVIASKNIMQTYGSHNLFGDSSKLSADLFVNFVPDSQSLIAAIDGNRAASFNEIVLPLSNNGGNTLTHALTKDSIARDAGQNALCLSNDQLGQPRNDKTCDIGAFEFTPKENFFVVPLPNGKSVIFSL